MNLKDHRIQTIRLEGNALQKRVHSPDDRTRCLTDYFYPNLEKSPETNRLTSPTIHQNLGSKSREQIAPKWEQVAHNSRS